MNATPEIHVDNVESVSAGSAPPPSNDTWLVRLVVIAIAVIVLTAMGVLTVLLASEKSVADAVVVGFIGLSSTGLGALAALLVSTASSRH